MSIFHLKFPHMKHEENSIRGIREAARKHFDEVDLDLLITKADPECPVCEPGECEGHIVGCHWDEPIVHDGFRDPKKKLDKHTKVREMTLPEVLRLRAGSRLRPYRISQIGTLLAECAKRDIGARLEPKDDKRFEAITLWRGVKATAVHLGTKVRGYSIRNLGGKGAGVRRVEAMKKAGIPSKVIH